MPLSDRLRGFVISGRPGEQAVTFSSARYLTGSSSRRAAHASEVRCPVVRRHLSGGFPPPRPGRAQGGKGVDEAIALHPACS